MKVFAKKIAVGCILVLFMIVSMSFYSRVDASDEGNVTRLWGNDRYETSISISRQGWQSSDYAVLCRGDDFPDALCAAPLAMKYDAPILLTEPVKLNEGVSKELERLGVKHVIITGGPGAVSTAIESLLKSRGIDVERLGGEDRYATSVEIAKKVGNSEKIVLATGENFPDSLSISSVAAKLGMPILLTSRNYLPYSVRQYLDSCINIDTTYIIGGKGVISDSVLELLRGAKRIGGNTRYETNVAVMREFGGVFDFKNIFLSVADGPKGDEFADALAGSVLAAKHSSPIVLVYKNLPAVTDYYLQSLINQDSRITILGGESVVPSSIADGLKSGGILPVYVGITDPPTTIKAWQKKTVSISTSPADATIKAYSSNANIAAVTLSGKTLTVTGVSPGIAVITVTAEKAGYPVGSSTFLVTSPVYNARRDIYYDSIQKAVDYAYSGDTIKISKGIYYEHINISTNNLKLIGEDRDNTIIDATQNGSVTKAGIRIKDYSGIEIENLTVRNTGVNVTGEAAREPYGIFMWNSDQDTIYNVSLKSNGTYEIYLLDGCDNNVVAGCTIDGSGTDRDGYRSLDGIFSSGGESTDESPGMVNSGNRFFNNVICNVVNGISLTASNDGMISGNEIHALDSSYWKGYSSAGIILGNSSSNAVDSNIIDSSQYGIRLSTFSSISPYAYAGASSSNTMKNNKISTINTGIKVAGTDNIVDDNLISKNSDSGIWISDSSWSTEVTGNTLQDNVVGLLVENGVSEFHKNSIKGGTYAVKNTSSIELDASLNWWGSDSGPGGRISGKIVYSPWALDEGCTKFSN